MNPQSYLNSRVLKLNVGYIIAEGPGFSRELDLNIPDPIRVSQDLSVEDLSGTIRLTRTSEGILLQGNLEFSVPNECSRCLDEILSTLQLGLEEIFEIRNPTEDDPFVIGENGILDLAPLIREEAFLNTPQQVLCRPNCEGLCPNCGQNWNDGTCDCAVEEIDPRWAGLADLQQQLSNRNKD